MKKMKKESKKESKKKKTEGKVVQAIGAHIIVRKVQPEGNIKKIIIPKGVDLDGNLLRGEILSKGSDFDPDAFLFLEVGDIILFSKNIATQIAEDVFAIRYGNIIARIESK